MSIKASINIDEYMQNSVDFAIENGYAIVSRNTTGLTDNDVPDGDRILATGGILVHAHGSNTYEEINTYSSVQSIISVRGVNTSYGLGSEFTLTEYPHESYCTAYMAGKMAEYGISYPALSYTTIRQAIRDNASNGGTWEAITGYGTPDWDATETALSEM